MTPLRQSDSWLMVGSAPSVLDWLQEFRRVLHQTVIITCNSGIKLIERPDYYICIESVSESNYRNHRNRAREAGTQVVSLSNSKWPADIRVALNSRVSTHRGQYGRLRSSGCLCLEFACNRGAKAIHIIGVDGYRASYDYFDPDQSRGPMNDDDAVRWNRDILAPKCTELALAWPEIQFAQYGDPVFSVDAPNWCVIHELPSAYIPGHTP